MGEGGSGEGKGGIVGEGRGWASGRGEVGLGEAGLHGPHRLGLHVSEPETARLPPWSEHRGQGREVSLVDQELSSCSAATLPPPCPRAAPPQLTATPAPPRQTLGPTSERGKSLGPRSPRGPLSTRLPVLPRRLGRVQTQPPASLPQHKASKHQGSSVLPGLGSWTPQQPGCRSPRPGHIRSGNSGPPTVWCAWQTADLGGGRERLTHTEPWARRAHRPLVTTPSL